MTTTPWAVPASIASAIQQRIDSLADLDILIGEALDTVRLDDSGTWLRVGAIVAHHSGVIEIIPCADATLSQLDALIRKAEEVRVDGPVGPAWRWNVRLGWIGSIYERVATSASPSPRSAPPPAAWSPPPQPPLN